MPGPDDDIGYASKADLIVYGLPGPTLAQATPDQQDKALEAASAVASSYLRSRYELPLSQWGADLRSCVCKLAAFELLSGAIGYNPEADGDRAVQQRAKDATGWLKDIAAQRATPEGIVDSSATGEANRDGPNVLQASTDPRSGQTVVGPPVRRGW